MSKTAPISIDSFDPEVLAAAREVAKRRACRWNPGSNP